MNKKKKKEKNLKNGFSLVEVLVMLVITSSVMIVMVVTMLNASRISINNEIADRAKTMSVRVLEIAKLPSNSFSDCNNSSNTIILRPGRNFAVGNIDFASTTNNTQLATSFLNTICLKDISAATTTNNSEIITCEGASRSYLTTVKFPNDPKYRSYNEEYCIQIYLEPIPNSKYNKIVIVTVFRDLSRQYQTSKLYAYK